MTKTTSLKLGLLATSALAGLVVGCAYLQVVQVCNVTGDECVIGIGVGGDLCTDGTPVPTGEECIEEQDLGPVELGQMSIVTNTNYGIDLTSVSSTGTVSIYNDNVLVDTTFTPFIVQDNVHKFADPAGVSSFFSANLTNPSGNYSMQINPPSFNLTTGAPAGSLVSLTSTLMSGSMPVASDNHVFTAGQNGEPVYGQFTGPLD